MVMWHLRKKGPLTPLEALRLYGIGRLAARVHQLNAPLPQKLIVKEMVTRFTRHGKAKVAEYRIRAA